MIRMKTNDNWFDKNDLSITQYQIKNIKAIKEL